jgi:hypothetical protein
MAESLHTKAAQDRLSGAIERLVHDAVHVYGVPALIAAPAGEATMRAMQLSSGPPPVLERRAADYFWGAVRGIAFRTKGAEARSFRLRLVSASFEHDIAERPVEAVA